MSKGTQTESQRVLSNSSSFSSLRNKANQLSCTPTFTHFQEEGKRKGITKKQIHCETSFEKTMPIALVPAYSGLTTNLHIFTHNVYFYYITSYFKRCVFKKIQVKLFIFIPEGSLNTHLNFFNILYIYIYI